MARIRLPFKFKVKNNSIISQGAIICWAIGILTIIWGASMITQINTEYISDLIIIIADIAIGISLMVVGTILQIHRVKDLKNRKR